MRSPGLTNFSGMRRTSTNAAPGLDVRLSSAATRRRNLALATLARHDGVRVWACRHAHNVLMTLIAHTTNGAADRRRAARLGAMLLGTGTAHFVAPKPFDDIVPAELPGSARFYTYASGAAELFVSVFPANVNMVRLWWDKP
jgi:hypothetical protein